jgi:glutaminyl-tRNA synthetase
MSESPDKVEEGHTFLENLNPNSLQVVKNCKIEKFLATSKALDKYQFERLGYFSTDYDSTEEHLVFNRACTLKDSWSNK